MVAKGRNEDDITLLFQPQRDDGDCLPACFKSILDEYRDRHSIRKSIKYTRLRKALKCHPKFGTGVFGPEIQAALDSDLGGIGLAAEFGYGPGGTLDQLRGVLTAARASFPIVSLRDTWWEDDAVPVASRGNPAGYEHCVVVLDVTEDVVEVHDPLVRKMNSSAPEKYIFTVPAVRFLQHWRATEYPHWTLWLRHREQGYQATIGEYDG